MPEQAVLDTASEMRGCEDTQKSSRSVFFHLDGCAVNIQCTGLPELRNRKTNLFRGDVVEIGFEDEDGIEGSDIGGS